MEVFTLNVGQGNLVVLRHEGEAFIIDSHIPSREDAAAVFVKATLPSLLAGHKLVGLVLTSFDADHADPRGIAWILRRYWPRWIMYPQYWKDSETAAAVMTIIRDIEVERRGGPRPLHRISVRLDKVADRVLKHLADGVEVEVFSPHPEDMTNSNNCSLVVRLAPSGWLASGFSYLVTGDTENRRWESMNRIFGAAMATDVLAAPHHGSENAINAATLQHINPSVVLISAGRGNPFGHPHRRALHLYRKAGADWFSTHHGISLRTYQGFWGGIHTEAWTPA